MSEMNRRDFLKAGGAVVALALVAGCAPGSQSPAPEGSGGGQPRRGGVFRFPVNAPMTPWPPRSAVQDLAVNKVIYNQLVKYGKDLTPQPDLAERWEVSADGLTWTFYLRKDVTWHDGRPFTADDVKFSLEVFKDPKAGSVFLSNLAPIVRIETPDKYAVRLITNEPFSSLGELLAYNIFIMPRHRLEGQDITNPVDFINRPVGTGPFKFEEHVRGDHLTVVRNENYYQSAPYLDAIIFKVIPELNTQVAQLRTGEVDIAVIAMDHFDALKDVPGIRIDEAYQFDIRYMGLNFGHPRVGRWFADRNIRQALAHAIDRQAIIRQITREKGLPATNIIPPFFKAWYNPNLKPYEYNPERAGRLLREAGWQPGPDGVLQKGGERFEFEALVDRGNTEREQTALLVQQYLKGVGVQANINLMEFNTMVTQRLRTNRDQEVAIFYFALPNSPDVYNYVGCGTSYNYYSYCNQELDRLFREARRLFDYEKRRDIYYKVQEFLAQEEPWVFLYHPVELRAMSRKLMNFPAIGWRDAMTFMNEVWLEQ